ncbi:RsmB/NOP family class I SAM-dependent RNA methyltransferase [Flavobacteriaceae bacterium]|nr:RsmB/NOP family class I SAM-dependent RNA methyltransferase [Flavobacteriaceae bacterium]MDA9571942.1 RsmB/NOP family class I SAM-dependent RNA methyltransferase [Flavobacteriaceae bacterium]MDC3354306.1 RsmB/NOP family class I SAM-dependent RNA methyltransferase [Flavobacteriaceae bacterium]
MKIHRNIGIGIVEGLQQILIKKEALRPCLNQLLKQNKKWGSRDRRQLGEAVLDCIRWKRTYEYLGNLSEDSRNYKWELLGVWLLTKGMSLPEWEELSNLKDLKISFPLDPNKTERKIRESIPDWLDELGTNNFDETIWGKEIQVLNTTAPLVLRCNTLKHDIETLQKSLKNDFKIETTQLKEVPEALILEKHQKLNQNPLFLKGFFEIQDANSQRVAHWIAPEPGDLIVDSCAGGGGKSLHLAALMKNKGKIFALDLHEKKLEQLQKRALRNGVSNIQTSSAENTPFYIQQQGKADAVLIDAPCSGLGVIRRNPAAKWHMNPDKIQELENLQQELLQKNAPLVKKGGKLIYATCSIFPNENQNQIKHFLKTEIGSEFQLDKEETFLSHLTNFDGFYIARLKKNRDTIVLKTSK